MPLKRFKFKNIREYDTIVFGGWVMGGTIQGLNKFLQHYEDMKDKNVIVYAVGLSMPTNEGRALLIEQNLLDLYHVRFYQLRGSFDIKKLHFPYNLLFRTSLQAMLSDPNATEDMKAWASLKNAAIEAYDAEKVQKIATVINSLSSIEAR
jgi:hypothetical protein